MDTLTRRLTVGLVGVFFAIMIIAAALAGARTLNSPTSRGQSSDPGWFVGERSRDLRILGVRKGGPAEGALQSGDVIVALNGRDVLGGFHTGSLFENLPPNTPYTIVVDRDGEILQFSLRTAPFPRGVRALLPLATILIPGIFLLSGLAVFLLKPNDKQSRLLALTFATSSGLFASDFTPGLAGSLQLIVFAAAVLASFFWPIFLHFFLIFPTNKEALSPILRRFPRIEWFLYLPHIFLTLPYSLVWSAFGSSAPDEFARVIGSYGWLSVLATVLPVAYVAAGLLSLLINYQRAGHLLRRKMRVVVAGSVFALLPMVSFIALEVFFSESLNEGIMIWLAVVAVSAFALFPFSFLYAIARHQVIPVRLILRRGARYVFVSSGSIIVEIVAVGIVLTLLLGVVFSHSSLTPLQTGVISGAVSVFVWQVSRQVHHSVIAPLIDRSFFRQAYNAQQVLSELGQTLRVTASIDDRALVDVCERIRTALNAENVSMFIREDASGNYRCAALSRHSAEPEAQPVLAAAFDGSGFVVRRLRELIKPLRVDFEDPRSWSVANGARPDQNGDLRDAQVLTQLRSALLMPIATKEALIGVMSLGPRLGDLPYSREDEELLSAVAWQIAYAIENAHLIQQKADEERLQQEMEFATQVQKRLFPQVAPSTNSVDLSGLCQPARGVGGDYYDFLTLADGRIGIAVADVSGKGISAALLMSTVQASLRTQAPLAHGNLTDLVASMNRLLCDSTDLSHYATFFYAEYSEATHTLAYVNAGHNPPMLFSRRKDIAAGVAGAAAETPALRMVAQRETFASVRAMSSVQLLERGGPVIGLLRDCGYDQGAVQVVRGDVLVAYTDGVTEARNPEDEEFGEERLARFVLAHLDLNANELADRIVSEIGSWCRGVPLQDDLTLVVVKLKD